MSPVEPSPVLIGRMGLPSIARADGLGFLPKNAALSSEGANMPPVSVPSAARNERRFQPNFSFMPIRPFPVAANNYLSAGGAGGVTTSAAYDLDQRIPGNPFDGHAGAGRRFA